MQSSNVQTSKMKYFTFWFMVLVYEFILNYWCLVTTLNKQNRLAIIWTILKLKVIIKNLQAGMI